MIAELVGQGACVVDVGTDHGYLPVHLVMNGAVRAVTATDIRKGPLDRAKASAAEFGVSDRIKFILADGLDGVDDGLSDTGGGYDTVVIAGMGGETIIRILEKAPWTLQAHRRLILQPQTKTDELVTWLYQNGYGVFDASLALDERRLYLVLIAGSSQGDITGGPLDILLQKRDALLPDYLAGLIKKTHRALCGLHASSVRLNGALEQQQRALGKLLWLKEETDKWQK